MSEKDPVAESWPRALTRQLFFGVVVAAGLLFLMPWLLDHDRGGIRQAPKSTAVQKAHVIGAAMFAYANDHELAYPDGKSSTEVFKKLLDGGYVSDPSVFYIPYFGKVAAKSGQKLKPENVCFDVTTGANRSSPDQLPLVFITGYKVSYAPESPPIALFKIFDGIVVYYRGNNATVLDDYASGGGRDIPINHFIPADFKSEGHTYRQLTPDGTVP